MENKFYGSDMELIAEGHKELIGKRAKFKNNLKWYSHNCWNKKGVIVDSELTPYLYLKFDEPIRQGYEGSMVSKAIVICKDSIEVM